jgi:hypothetical protein
VSTYALAEKHTKLRSRPDTVAGPKPAPKPAGLAERVLQLQRDAGNAAVTKLIEPYDRSYSGDSQTPREDPVVGSGPNPYWGAAKEEVGHYFGVLREHVTYLGTIQRDALDEFEVNADTRYEGSGLLEVFLAVLDLVPLAGSLAKLAKSMAGKAAATQAVAGSLARLEQAGAHAAGLERVEEGVSAAIDVVKSVAGYSQLPGEPAVSSGPADLGEMRVVTINSIEEFETKAIDETRKQEETLRARLDKLQNSRPSLDLYAAVQSYTRGVYGDLPEAGGLAPAVEEAKRKFELALYKKYFEGRAVWRRIRPDGGDDPDNLELDGVPERVQLQVKVLTKTSSLHEALHDWKIPIRDRPWVEEQQRGREELGKLTDSFLHPFGAPAK